MRMNATGEGSEEQGRTDLKKGKKERLLRLSLDGHVVWMFMWFVRELIFSNQGSGFRISGTSDDFLFRPLLPLN